MKRLDFKKCKTNKDVCNAVSERVNSVPFDTLLEEVEKRFVFQEKATKAIYTGLSENINVFLSGPGGYGKSTLIKHILDFYGIPYSIVVGYKNMPVDALLGIPNMDKLLTESKYEINFKDSIFCKPGILIGEEFTDILPSTAAALKDILTERGLQGQDGKVESMISCMIIAANKSALEVIDDESKRAFYEERFPLRATVEWESFTADDYMQLLKITFKDAIPEMLFFMAKLLEDNHTTFGNTISPRIACDITGVYLNKGVNFIDQFTVNTSNIIKLQKIAKIEFNKASAVDSLNRLQVIINNIENLGDKKLASLYALKELTNMTIKENIVMPILNTKTFLEFEITRNPYYNKYISEIDLIIKELKSD